MQTRVYFLFLTCLLELHPGPKDASGVLSADGQASVAPEDAGHSPGHPRAALAVRRVAVWTVAGADLRCQDHWLLRDLRAQLPYPSCGSTGADGAHGVQGARRRGEPEVVRYSCWGRRPLRDVPRDSPAGDRTWIRCVLRVEFGGGQAYWPDG